MKNIRRLLLGMAMTVAVLDAGVASSAAVFGIPSSVGTFGQDLSSALVRVHIENGTCDGVGVPSVFIIIRSGRLDGNVAEINSLSMKNAYSTLLAALLSGQTVDLRVPTCSLDAEGEILMDLPTGQVNILAR
jgi:hypothetical protein